MDLCILEREKTDACPRKRRRGTSGDRTTEGPQKTDDAQAVGEMNTSKVPEMKIKF